MTEKSYWWTTGGAGDGAATYTRVDLSEVIRIVTACHSDEGICRDYLNKFAGTVPGANTARIDTGAAVVDGKPYSNSATVDVSIPSAVGGGNTRIDRIVLRADWTAQTVRIFRIAGTDAAVPVAPAISQISGTTYDIMLYQALVDTAGAVTLTDERVYAFINAIVAHQGLGLPDYINPGTSNFYDETIMQCGSIQKAAGGGANGTLTVTYPVPFGNAGTAFAGAPITIAQATYPAPGAAAYYPVVSMQSGVGNNTTGTIYWKWSDGAAHAGDSITIFWMAIGPRP